MDLDIAFDTAWPDMQGGEADWPMLAHRAAEAAARVAPELANPRLGASLLFTDDAAMRGLNAQWRGKDAATNVLAFPMLAPEALRALAPAGPPCLLGDIALGLETCVAEAEAAGDRLMDHAMHLMIHGFLHLAGHDHQEDAEAEAMMALEIQALALIGLDNPYRERP